MKSATEYWRMTILAMGVLFMPLAIQAQSIPVPSFSGNNSYILVDTRDALQIPDDSAYTVEGWIYLNALSSRDMLYSKNNVRGNPYTYMHGFMDSGEMTAYDGSSWIQPSPRAYGVSGVWMHVAFAYDGTNMMYYLNGEYQGSASFGFSNDTNHTVKLGGYHNASDINGMKSDIRVWDHARDESDIRLMRNWRLRGDETGLLGYWRLDEGQGDTVADLTGNGCEGTLMNNASWTTTTGLVFHTFVLRDRDPGSVRFTNTNDLDILLFPRHAGYDHYQITEDGVAPDLDPAAWAVTSPPPATLDFDLPAGDQTMRWTVWFTNWSESLPMLSNTTEIIYTTTGPDIAIHPTLNRVLIPGETVAEIFYSDIDDGTGGGEAEDKTMTFTYGLYCENDETPELEHITISSVGVHDVVLTVTNEAGNVGVATSVVTVLERTEPYLYVSQSGNNTTGDNWINGYTTMDRALRNAAAGDTIYVTGERYLLNAAIEWTLSGITIEGGYAGNDVGGLPGDLDPEQWPTVFEREGTFDHRVMEITGVNGGIIRYITIRNGYLYGTVNGGGILISDCSDLVIEACNIVSNRLDHRTNHDPKGAGIHAANSTLLVTNCFFYGNDFIGGNPNWNGSGSGAALYIDQGLAEIFGCMIVSNTAFSDGNQGGLGAGIFLNGGGPHRIFNTHIIHNLSHGRRHGFGGGIYMTGVDVALVENSIIAHNRAWGAGEREPRGGGIWMNGGTIRNTLIADNASYHTGGGVWMQHASSRLENVTIVDNTSDAMGSVAGLHMLDGTVQNSIVYDNIRTVDGVHVSITVAGGTVEYSCVWPLRDGPGNTDADPEWVDRPAGNYRVRPGAPGVDAGVNMPWMTEAFDVEFENPRIIGAAVDMGAYEVDLTSGPLVINFIASPDSALDELHTEITAYVAGDNTDGLYYWWDLDNNATIDLEGSDKQVVNPTYGPGTYSVRLVVSNSVGEIDELTKQDYLVVNSSLIYVSLEGDHSDGLSWDTAYTNIQAALNNAGLSNTILIAQGIYETNTFLSWSAHSHVTLRGGYEGVGSPGDHDPERWPTVLRQTSGSARVMLLNELDQCRLEQVTVTGGFVSADGGGLRILNSSDVTIVDCVISNNLATGGSNTERRGGGIYIEGSSVTIRRCRIAGNVSRVTSANFTGHSRGGGLYLESGSAFVENCVIAGNISRGVNNQGSFGGGVSHTAGTSLRLRNCLIYDNENTPESIRSHQGAGVELNNGGVLENCTIAGNRTYNADDAGAGLRVNAGAWVTNTIIFGNLRAGEPNDIGFGGSASEAQVFFSCAPELTDGINDNISADPRFRDLAAGDMRLRLDSACVDTGKDADWMNDALDLDGNPRIQWGRPDRHRRVDRGAYETIPVPGTLLRLQ